MDSKGTYLQIHIQYHIRPCQLAKMSTRKISAIILRCSCDLSSDSIHCHPYFNVTNGIIYCSNLQWQVLLHFKIISLTIKRLTSPHLSLTLSKLFGFTSTLPTSPVIVLSSLWISNKPPYKVILTWLISTFVIIFASY